VLVYEDTNSDSARVEPVEEVLDLVLVLLCRCLTGRVALLPLHDALRHRLHDVAMTLNDHLERFVESEMNEIESSVAQVRGKYEKLWDTLSYTEDQLKKAIS